MLILIIALPPPSPREALDLLFDLTRFIRFTIEPDWDILLRLLLRDCEPGEALAVKPDAPMPPPARPASCW
jgi:hypothetical protein